MIIAKHSPPTRRRSRCNGHHTVPPVEALSQRIARLRIERGYSVCELAAQAGTVPCVIHELEAGKPADKRILPALAAALGVPYCRLLCGDHDCAERACVPARATQ
ncbi:MAG TPA: helix-turn-helix domain-containing protein [Candidatus Elarobacter sp.]|nr:helix-turn-helix domain-containing protein [Candidatus Elarobacter sp.]